MQLRFFESKDHHMLAGWWTAWSWPVIPLEALPTIGIIAEDAERAWAVGFLYRTDSSLAWIEWLTVNPDAPRDERRQAMAEVLDALVESARTAGFQSVFTSVKHKTLIEMLYEHGFRSTDHGMINFVRRF